MTEANCSDSTSEIKSEASSVHKMTEGSCTDSSSEMKSEASPVHKMTEASCTNSSSEMKSDEETQLIYRCKKCRQIVASQQSIVSHEQGKGEASFGWRKRSVEPDTLTECTAIFVEPLKWMKSVQEGYVFDKLYCMGCKCRLGSFNWAGMQCSCGAWVNPAFQILKSRVDKCLI